ncbi:MAG: Mut7-C RNAse domain-containing protein [Candidatus Promineifilaceae bacterium]
MTRAFFRFYAELNDLLAIDRRRTVIAYRLNGPVAVKHPIEALGVPHTEVDLILVDGAPASFSHLVGEGDRIDVYPPERAIDLEISRQLRPELPNPPRFVLDGHLGQLTTYLRLLGFDALYQNDIQDEELAQIAFDEERVLLTRDVRLLMRKTIVHGYWLRSKEPKEQIKEVLKRFSLKSIVAPWHRCLRCNGRLRKVAKHEIEDRLEPLTKKYYHEFHICQDCDQIYWKGSHYLSLRQFIEEIAGEPV